MGKKLNKKDREVLRQAKMCGSDVDGDIITYHARYYFRIYYVCLAKNYIKPLTKRIPITKYPISYL